MSYALSDHCNKAWQMYALRREIFCVGLRMAHKK